MQRGALVPEFPEATVNLVLGIIKRNTKHFPDGHSEGIGFRTLLQAVNDQKANFMREHVTDEDISPGNFPGKLRLRNMVELLVKRELVMVLIGGLPVTDFSHATSQGRAWEIVAMETSAHYEALLISTLSRYKKLKARIKKLANREQFELQEFFEYASILSEASGMPMHLYYETDRLSLEAKMDLVRMTLQPARELVDDLIEVRKIVLGKFPDFDKIIRHISKIKEVIEESERPVSNLEAGLLSYYKFDMVTRNQINNSSAKVLGEKMEQLAKEQNIRFGDSVIPQPISESVHKMHGYLSVLKGKVLDMVLGEQ